MVASPACQQNHPTTAHKITNRNDGLGSLEIECPDNTKRQFSALSRATTVTSEVGAGVAPAIGLDTKTVSERRLESRASRSILGHFHWRSWRAPLRSLQGCVYLRPESVSLHGLVARPPWLLLMVVICPFVAETEA
jgi:hypothetical protein